MGALGSAQGLLSEMGAHVSMCSTTAEGAPPASRFMMDTARHLASSYGELKSASSRGTSILDARCAVPASVATSLSSCTGASSQICMLHRVHHGQLINCWTTASRPLTTSSGQYLPRSLHEQRCVMTHICIVIGQPVQQAWDACCKSPP